MEKKFKLVDSFPITVPADYSHGDQLDFFRKEYSKNFLFFHPEINDDDRADADRLKPGKTYQVKLFQPKERMTCKECLEFLKNQNGILAGAQGISLIWKKLPKGFWTVSFEKACGRMPIGYRYPSGDGRFRLGHFVSALIGIHMLICFCEK